MSTQFTVNDIKFGPHGLIPVCVQDAKTKDVLIIGSANAEALRLTLNTGNVHLWSKSRNELWLKGATSGDFLKFREAHVNCEANTLVILADPITGIACHKNTHSCFDSPAGGKRLLKPDHQD